MFGDPAAIHGWARPCVEAREDRMTHASQRPQGDIRLPGGVRGAARWGSLPRGVGNAVHLSRPEDDFKSGSLGRFRACRTGSVDEVVELSVDGSGAGAS